MIGWMFLALSAAVALRPGSRPHPTTPVPDTELTPADPAYYRLMCGPMSLVIGLGRLGVAQSPAEIARQCRVTARGVALTDLDRVVRAIPEVTASLRRVTFDELRGFDGVAVLFVNQSHFVTVDPRDVSSKGIESIRLYDGDTVARFVSADQLNAIWSGESLMISRSVPPAPSQAPRSDWNHTYLDLGFIDESTARFHYHLRNAGQEVLEVEQIEKSCGCLSHQLSRTRLAPGESAELNVDIDLKDKEGYVHQTMTVRTNEPSRPATTLHMICGVPRALPVSVEAMRLDDLTQGGTTTREIVVGDRRFTGIRIRAAEFEMMSPLDQRDLVRCRAEFEPIRDNAPRVKQQCGYPAAPGDYLVRLTFQANSRAPSGPFEGELRIEVDDGESISTERVSITGHVLQDVQAQPRLVLISVDRQGSGCEIVRLESASGKPVLVRRVVADDPRLAVEHMPGSARYRICAHAPELVPGDVPIQSRIRFELPENEAILVPVTLFRAPQ